MNYLDKLVESAEKRGSIVCMGLDPVIEAMPEEFSRYGVNHVDGYLENIFREMIDQKVFPGAFKPNEGFYSRHDKGAQGAFPGRMALSRVLKFIRVNFPDIPVILDNKRGDIAKSSANYAVEGFEGWQADAVTVSPYMGKDSIMPFGDYCNDEQGKGIYILNRTSNPGASDFQSLDTRASMSRLYKDVAEKIIEWATDHSGVGAVIGATSPEELGILVNLYMNDDVNYNKNQIPLLIPGVGGQGGKADEVVAVLREAEYDLRLARINSSSGITHPWAKQKQAAPDDYAKVCVAELNALNEAIGPI
ncbi:orotidine-5'-phosphate decarboxylase [Candidatus Woesearchaeota archaeon B3_Woes]|nr:MAG: orotidine-5'-phosphate decarboxylase [Candidatus Woesearchaeota archaeon B3_Woes]